MLPGSSHAQGTILGSYRLDDVLGEGGMGVVYLATHTRLGRRVAIKILKSQYANNAAARRRFFGEARAVNKIAHQNIIEITDFVERPGEDNYYVMELLEGVDLAELVRLGGMLTLSRSVGVMTQVAEALGAVHRAGIVHLDLKPQNILLIQRGARSDFVKVVDFGIARTIEVFDDVTSIPEMHSHALATPQYMSPEQASGLPLDYRSDTYSFGITLYELATGRRPVAGNPVPPSEIAGLPHVIPPALDKLMLACLETDPRNRPAQMEDIVERLLAIAIEQGWNPYEAIVTPSMSMRAITPAVIAAPEPTAKRRWWPLAFVAAAIVIAIPIAIVMLRSGAPSVESKVEAELVIADQRIAAGNVVSPTKDGALDHLLGARVLAPDHPGVRERLHAIARTYEHLAHQAFAAGSLPEAATHLETVLLIEPDNEAAAAKIHEIEAEILVRQQIRPTVE